MNALIALTNGKSFMEPELDKWSEQIESPKWEWRTRWFLRAVTDSQSTYVWNRNENLWNCYWSLQLASIEGEPQFLKLQDFLPGKWRQIYPH